MIALDTSAIIELLKGTEKGKKIASTFGSEEIASSTVSINEVLIGALGKQREIAHAFVDTLKFLDLDVDAAKMSVDVEESLARNGKMIGKLDIFIAATALAQGLALLTADKDFKNVAGLKVILV